MKLRFMEQPVLNPALMTCPTCQEEQRIGIHSQVERRYRCHACGRTFAETQGTAFFGLHYPIWVVVLAVTLLAYGCPVAALVAATQGEWGLINTAYIERFNATLRSRIATLVRRTRSLARTVARLEIDLYWTGIVYNFCTVHDTLKGTPAMAIEWTDHVWSRYIQMLWMAGDKKRAYPEYDHPHSPPFDEGERIRSWKNIRQPQCSS